MTGLCHKLFLGSSPAPELLVDHRLLLRVLDRYLLYKNSGRSLLIPTAPLPPQQDGQDSHRIQHLNNNTSRARA